MVDRVNVFVPKSRVNERTQFTASVRFREAGVDAIPTTADYRVVNQSTGEVVRDWTALVPAASIDIVVLSSDNQIRNEGSDQERMQIIVAADRGGSSEMVATQNYVITHVKGHGLSGSTIPVEEAVLTGPLSPGNVLKWGADPTGVKDSTPAFQAAVDSDYAVYVPHGDFRINGTITIKHEKAITCERAYLPVYRHWARPDQAPWTKPTGSQTRLFKDDASQDSDYFHILWGGVDIVGFPLFDVSDKTSYTSAACKMDIASINDYSSNNRPRLWGNRLEIFCIGNFDTIGNVGEGMKCIEVFTDPIETQFGYITMQEWTIYCQLVNYAIYAPDLASGGNQFANSLNAKVYADGAKMMVLNDCLNSSQVEGVFQARNIINDAERDTYGPVIEGDAGRCLYDVHAYDLSGDLRDGLWRPTYFLQNNGQQTTVTNRSSYSYRNITGYETRGHRWSIQNAPFGVMPWMARNSGNNINGMVVTAFYNMIHNVKLRATSFSWAVHDGTAVDQADVAVSDAVFANASGNSVDITSALNELPTFVVGSRFNISDHSDEDNNGEFIVDAVITDGYTCTMYGYRGWAGTPADASAEAVVVEQSYGARTDDSTTEGIATSSDFTETKDLDNITNSYGDWAAITWDADAVTDGDYLEYHFSGFTYAASYFWLSFNSNGGWTKAQVIRKNSGVIVDNVIIDMPGQADEDPLDIAKITVGGQNADETILRLIGPRDSSKAYTFMDVAAIDNSPQAAGGHFITKRGGETIQTSLRAKTYLQADGHIRLPTYTTSNLEDVSHDVNTNAAKQEGVVVFNQTTNRPVYAVGNADADVWVDATGSTAHTPV